MDSSHSLCFFGSLFKMIFSIRAIKNTCGRVCFSCGIQCGSDGTYHQKSAPLFFLFFYCLSQTLGSTDPNLILQPPKHFPFFRNTRSSCLVSHSHLTTTQSSASFHHHLHTSMAESVHCQTQPMNYSQTALSCRMCIMKVGE